MTTPANKWDRIYSDREVTGAGAPASLVDNAHLLPRRGQALDLACGLGGAAIFLARRGLEVTAWDSSALVIDKLRAFAAREELPLCAEHREVGVERLPAAQYDVIVVANFLVRDACREIAAALRPGGLLFYETFSLESRPGARHKNPDYCLRRGELLELFSALHPVVWREEALLGETSQGQRGSCTLIAQARPPEPRFFTDWRRRVSEDDAPDALSRAIALHRPRIRRLADRLAHLVADDPALRSHEWGLIDAAAAVIVPDSCPPELAIRALIVLKGAALLPSDLAEGPLRDLGELVDRVSRALAEVTGAPSCRVWTPHPNDRRSQRVYLVVDSGAFAGDLEEKRAVWADFTAAFAR
ncbi:MAG: class I SAM-dependent methyltransferase [Myxococcales bacterium]|nr:class I SAM-dependent methyltransferase [Myxococcales bacterium]